MYRSLVFALLAAFLILGGCGDKASNPESDKPRPVTETEEQLVDSFNRFGLDLFKELVRGERDENVFVSPLSVSMALGMTYNGAAGTTEEAMRNTLKFDDLTLEQINGAYRSLIDLLGSLDPDVQFQLANSIWYRMGVTFRQDFIDRNQIYFNAEVRGLDFSAPEAAATINDWVSENTGDRIEDIVSDPIDPMTVMFLINAIYFKGSWTYEFDTEETEDDVFMLPGGVEAPCRMMNQAGDFMYFRGMGFQAIDLPYGNGDFSMVVILPDRPKNDIDSIIDALDQETWIGWLESFDEQEGHIQLPKFTLEYEAMLNKVLTALGMGVAFDMGAADFSGMYSGPQRLFISKVKHKSFVTVDEEGTEAAAATSVEVGITSPTGFRMRVDHPFLFAIRDSHTQTILFMGKIVEPLL